MRKFFAAICALVLAFSVTACNNTPSSPDVKANANANSSASSNSIASSASNSGANSIASSSTASTNASSSASPKFGYQYTTEKYRFDKNKKNLKVNYTQLSAEASNAEKANALLKKVAMQTLDAMGTSKLDYIEVKSSVTYHNDSFISNTFEETSRVAGSKVSVGAFRTVIFDLNKGVALSADDVVLRGDKLNALLLTKVKDKVKTKQKPLINADLIKKSMESCSVYFRKGNIGFSLPVSRELGDHLEIELTFEEAKPFMTKSEIWNSLTANK